MPSTDPILVARSQIAHAVRNDWPPEKLAEARRALTAAKVERAVREAVAAYPPLTDEQKAGIAALLTGGGGR